MVNRVVSTKLTEEEHTTLLDACSIKGQTPSSFIKDAILDKLKPTKQPEEILTGLGADKMTAKKYMQPSLIHL